MYSTLKDSCYTELCWAIHRLKWTIFLNVRQAPWNYVYSYRSKIYFRGLDDPFKNNVNYSKTGSLCWLWIEEAYEITNEDDFNMLDESIRGSVDKSIFKQITITLNPWNERHWIKARFFDVIDSNIMAKSTNYMCNEWLDESDLKVLKIWKEQSSPIQSCRLGWVGHIWGLSFWKLGRKDFSIDELKGEKCFETVFGLDFRYTNDPTALFCGFINTEKRKYMFLMSFTKRYEQWGYLWGCCGNGL